MAGIRYKGQIFSGVASVGDADEVSYDNTQSGLTASNVQDAVDELNSKKAETYDWYVSDPDLNVGLITNVRSDDKSQAALQSHSGTNGWRLLIGLDGVISKYKTTNGGANWTFDKRIEIKRAQVYSNTVSIATNSTNIDFSLPSDFHMSLGAIIQKSWPQQTWDPTACVSIREDCTMNSTPIGRVRLSSTTTQNYAITIMLIYI